jgi:hypothetical protein
MPYRVYKRSAFEHRGEFLDIFVGADVHHLSDDPAFAYIVNPRALPPEVFCPEISEQRFSRGGVSDGHLRQLYH